MYKTGIQGQNGKGLLPLKVINLSNNNLDDFDAHVMNCLYMNFELNLDVLNLSNNHFGQYDGALCIMNLNMYPYINIKSINLSNNGLTDNAAKQIADNLDKVPALQYLDVSGNNITEVGETNLVQAIQGVWQDIVIFRHSLDEIVKISGDEGREAQIAVLKNIIERGKAIGTYDEAIVVDKSFWGGLNNVGKNIAVGFEWIFGFSKCHLLPEPEQVVESYAQDKIIATLPLKTASGLSFIKKYVGNLLNFHDVITCFVSSREDALTSELGQQAIKYELCLLGEEEFCGENE